MLFVQSTPLYLKVARRIIELIGSDAYTDNILPSEGQLSKMLGVSRNTLREALAELTSQGIIAKKQGIGNILMRSALETKFRIDLKIDFTNMLKELGYQVRYEQSYSRFEEVENEAYRETALVYDEVMYAGDAAAAVMHITIPARLFNKEVPRDLPKKDFFEFMFNYTNEIIAHSLVFFEASESTPAMQKLFRLEDKRPLLSWKERFHNLQDDCISYNTIFFNPGLFRPSMLRSGFYQEDLDSSIVCTTREQLFT